MTVHGSSCSVASVLRDGRLSSARPPPAAPSTCWSCPPAMNACMSASSPACCCTRTTLPGFRVQQNGTGRSRVEGVVQGRRATQSQAQLLRKHYRSISALVFGARAVDTLCTGASRPLLAGLLVTPSVWGRKRRLLLSSSTSSRQHSGSPAEGPVLRPPEARQSVAAVGARLGDSRHVFAAFSNGEGGP